MNEPFGVDVTEDPDKLDSGESDALVVIFQRCTDKTVDVLLQQDASLVPH